MIVDSHHHLWRVDRSDYPWMTPEMPVLARDYLLQDLEPELRKAGITATVLVQAAPTEAETDFLLDIAAGSDVIAGVTGWLDLDSEAFPASLERLRRHPKFVAIRPMIQDLDDDRWILRPGVLASLRCLADADVPLELLTYPRHLEAVGEALGATPGLRAVLNHLSKPPIASGRLEPWATGISRLAAFPNLVCKLSGLVTEADHRNWRLQDLSPYVDHVVHAFGTDRLLFGSDWPVCRLAAEYGEVANALRTLLAPHFGPTEIDKVFGANAIRFYRLELPG